jgi:hypothetical protein
VTPSTWRLATTSWSGPSPGRSGSCRTLNRSGSRPRGLPPRGRSPTRRVFLPSPGGPLPNRPPHAVRIFRRDEVGEGLYGARPHVHPRPEGLGPRRVDVRRKIRVVHGAYEIGMREGARREPCGRSTTEGGSWDSSGLSRAFGGRRSRRPRESPGRWMPVRHTRRGRRCKASLRVGRRDAHPLVSGGGISSTQASQLHPGMSHSLP